MWPQSTSVQPNVHARTRLSGVTESNWSPFPRFRMTRLLCEYSNARQGEHIQRTVLIILLRLFIRRSFILPSDKWTTSSGSPGNPLQSLFPHKKKEDLLKDSHPWRINKQINPSALQLNLNDCVPPPPPPPMDWNLMPSQFQFPVAFKNDEEGIHFHHIRSSSTVHEILGFLPFRRRRPPFLQVLLHFTNCSY